MIVENLQTLKIHKLTEAQYQRTLSEGNIDPNALYLTPDESLIIDNTLSIDGAAADAKAVGDANADIREKIAQISSEKFDASKIVQNTGDSIENVMSQAAVTTALENLTTLPYGGYYTPTVTQTEAGTMTIGYTASKSGMPKVEDQKVELPAGPVGVTPKFTVGTVITGEAGADAAVSITGSDANPVLRFVIPAGPKGDPGSDGRSAYQYAVDGGYTGTEEEFARKLAADVGAIPVPETATVGQTIVVKAVDENGKPTEWEAADFPETYATLTSPDGTEWTLVVSNDGILSAITKVDQYDIFIIGGQSNVVGYGTPMLSTDTFPDKTYQYKQDGSIEAVANYPLDHLEAYANQIGFQHTFLDAYIEDGKLESGRKILLIPCGHPGTSFVSGRWAEGGDLQTAMMNRITAVKELVGSSGAFKAILWHQGESDVIEGNTVETYRKQLGALIDNVRTITGNIPFIMGEWQQDWLATYGDRGIQMQSVLSEIAAEKENCYLVSADGLTGDSKNGTIHFSAEAQRTFGERYYAAYQISVGDESEPSEPDVTSVYDVLRLDARSGINGNVWKDASGNGYDATLYNFNGSLNSGLNDGSLVFDGSDDYVQFPEEAFDFGSDDFTIQMIAKANGRTQVLLSQSNAGHSDTTIQIFSSSDNGGEFCYQVYFADETCIDKTVTLNADMNSFAFVRSGETITLYLNDNAFYTENIGTKAIRSTTTPVTLGKWGEGTTMYLHGEVRFVGVTKRALTVEEISAITSEFIS